MNAAIVTHGLKLIGGNTRMWVGVMVIALALALLVHFLERSARNTISGLVRVKAYSHI